MAATGRLRLLLVVAVCCCCLSAVRAFLLPASTPSSSSSVLRGPGVQPSSIHDALAPPSRNHHNGLLTRRWNGGKDKGTSSSTKRRRRRATKPTEGGAGNGKGGDDGPAPAVGVGRFDPALSNLIEDERKSALPRLEDLKRGREAAGKSGADLPTGATPGILLPREREELKAKERAKEATKGAPPYFDLMTRLSWGGIAVLIIAEVVVQIFRTN